MRPRLSALDLWQRHEERVLKILGLALEKLRCKQALPEAEDPINRELCFCIRSANHELQRNGRGIYSTVMYEARNQPLAEDEGQPKRELKRPDFQWGFVNSLEPNPDLADMFYTIECKRLGKPKRRDRVFNANYIIKGICRFRDADYGYGKGTSSGAMIGYVQSMELGGILSEVNATAKQENIPILRLSSKGWQKGKTSRLDHALSRPKVPPTPFELRHLWVDLRMYSC